jgi:hypothetical protein
MTSKGKEERGERERREGEIGLGNKVLVMRIQLHTDFIVQFHNEVI